jgi:hypothetical protein
VRRAPRAPCPSRRDRHATLRRLEPATRVLDRRARALRGLVASVAPVVACAWARDSRVRSRPRVPVGGRRLRLVTVVDPAAAANRLRRGTRRGRRGRRRGREPAGAGRVLDGCEHRPGPALVS